MDIKYEICREVCTSARSVSCHYKSSGLKLEVTFCSHVVLTVSYGHLSFPSALQLCGSDEFWEQAVRRRCDTVSAEVASLALEVGWRTIFFTSKLQLQKLISRRRLKTEEKPEGRASDSDAEEEEEESSSESQASGSEEESHLDICNLKLDTDTGNGFESSAHCDADLDPNRELEFGSDSIKSVPDQFSEGTSCCQAEALTHSGALSGEVGERSTDPDQVLT